MPQTDRIEMSWILNAKPAKVYAAWTSSEGHSDMTGASAVVDARVRGAFTAWDGYIWGATRKLEKNKRIIQGWRTADFKKSAPESRIEVLFQAHRGKTQLVLKHTNLQRGDGAKYTTGWYQFYLEPMVRFFGD